MATVTSKTLTITVQQGQEVGSISIAVSASTVYTGQTVTVSGVVYDTNNNPMSDQPVTLYENSTGTNYSTTSGSDGSYSISVVFSTAGTYNIYTEAT